MINEIKYFDKFYFESRQQNAKCAIDIYYSGHGQPGCLILSKNDAYFYSNLIDNLISNIDKHSVNLSKELDFSQHAFQFKFD